jgi:hypothetical protein
MGLLVSGGVVVCWCGAIGEVVPLEVEVLFL